MLVLRSMDKGTSRTVMFFILLLSGLCEVEPFYESILSIVSDNVDVDREPLVLCVSKIVSLYFRCRSTVAVALPTTENLPLNEILFGDSLIRILHQAPCWSVIRLGRGNYSELYPAYLEFVRIEFVVISGTADEVIDFLETSDVWKLLNEGSRFVVALQELAANTTGRTGDIQQVLNAAWKHDQLNIVILVRTAPDSVDVYSWLPLSTNAEPLILDSFTDGEFRCKNDLFPEKVPTDLNGFNIKFGVVSTPPYICKTAGGSYIGFENKIVETLAEILNFTPVYNSFASFGYDGWDNVLTSLQSGENDVSLGRFLQQPYRFQLHGHTITYKRDVVQWYVAGDLIIKEISDESALFTLYIKTTTAVIFLILMMTFAYLDVFTDRKHIHSVWLLVWSMLSELSFNIRHLRAGQKILWISLAFYILMMNTFSKSSVFSSLSKPTVTPNITTVHELLLSNIPLVFAAPAPPHAEFPDEPWDDKRIEARLLDCPNLICISDRLTQGPLAITAVESMMKLVEKWTPRPIFHTLDKPILAPQMTGYTRKNYFLLPLFRRYLRRILEAGLVDYWTSEFERHPDCDMKLTDLNKISIDRNRISSFVSPQLRGRKIQFGIIGFDGGVPFLFIGYGIAALFFLCEIIKSHQIGHHMMNFMKMFFFTRTRKNRDGRMLNLQRLKALPGGKHVKYRSDSGEGKLSAKFVED